jgi:hypothetical protein
MSDAIVATDFAKIARKRITTDPATDSNFLIFWQHTLA